MVPVLDMTLWLAADRITGLTNGAPVAQWNDLSGNNYHATQATGTKQPTYQQNVLNGRPVVRFDGVDDELALTGGALDVFRNVGGGTILAVVRPSRVDVVARVAWWSTGSDAVVNRLAAGINPNVWVVAARRNDADATAAITGGTPQTNQAVVLGAVVSYATSDAWLYVNGALVASSTAFLTDGNTSDTSSLAARVGSANNQNFWPGDLAEVIVYNRALTDGERQAVEGYLLTKWFGAMPRIKGVRLRGVSMRYRS